MYSSPHPEGLELSHYEVCSVVTYGLIQLFPYLHTCTMTQLSIDKPIDVQCQEADVERLTINFSTGANFSNNFHKNSIIANVIWKELFFSFTNSYSI